MIHKHWKIFLILSLIMISQNTYSIYSKILDNKKLQYPIVGFSGISIALLFYYFFWVKKSDQKIITPESKLQREYLLNQEHIITKLSPVLLTIETINRESLEEGFKIFLNSLFNSGIPRNPHDKKTFPVINLIGTTLKNSLSEDEYIKLILFIIEKNYDCHNCILDWTIKTDVPIFFKIIDKEGNTVLHHILSKKPLFYHFLPVLQYLLQKIHKTDRTLLDTKNSNGETILFSLLQNEHFKHMKGYEWKYINCLVGSGIDVNARNNKKQHVFDLVLPLPTLDQIELFWNAFNMPHYYDIPKYSPQDVSVKNYFKGVRKNIFIAADILKSFFSYFNTLHEYAIKMVKKDKGWYKNNSREIYIKSFWVLNQTREIIKSSANFSYIDWMFLESKERWIRNKEKIRKTLGPDEKMIEYGDEGLNYDVLTKIYRTEEEQKPYMRLENVQGEGEEEMDWKEYKPDPFYYHTIGYRWSKG